MKKKFLLKIAIIISIISFIFTTFNHVYVFALGVLKISITINEPIVGEKPSFDYDMHFLNFSTNPDIHEFVAWAELDIPYDEAIDVLNNLENMENSQEYILDSIDRVTINRNFLQFIIEQYESNNDSEHPSIDELEQIIHDQLFPFPKITEFLPEKTYAAVFFAARLQQNVNKAPIDSGSSTILMASESFDKEDGPLINDIDTIVNGETNAVKSVAVGSIIETIALFDAKPATQNIQASVNWVNANSNNIPDSLNLKLMNGNTVVKEETVTKSNSNTWQYTFTQVPVYDDNMNKINYSLTYSEVNKGDLNLFETTVDKFTITNTYVEPVVNSKIKLTSKVNRDAKNVKYKIDYKTAIKKYSGDAEIIITAVLPFDIDESKSDLDGGTFDQETHSIIWNESINDISNKYDYSTTKNIDLYSTAVLPYSIEVKTIGAVSLLNAGNFSKTVDATSITAGNPKTGDAFQKYLSASLVGIFTILSVINIKRKYSTKKSKIQF